MDKILSPDHPRWGEFVSRLERALHDDGCDSKHLRHAKRILGEMGGKIDVEETLMFFEDNGGYCDCEILMNIDPGFWDESVLH